MRSILFTLIIILNFSDINAQEIYSYDGLSNPDNFFVVDDSLLIVYDNSRTNEELCLTNIYTYDIINCTRKGKGPGEFSGSGVHFLIDRTDERIYMWDYGSQRVTKLTYQLEYVDDLNISERFRGALAVLPFDDSHQLYLRMNEDSFGEILDVKKDSVIAIVDNDHEHLVPTKNNFLLKQGNYSFDNEGSSIVFTSKYSSIVMNISMQGLEFITLGKPKMPFPERENNDDYGIPSLHKYTSSTIDISSFNGNLYVLHSGKSTTYREAFWYMVRGRILELAEDLETGNELLIYDLDDGSFLQSLRLPYEVRKAKIFGGNVFVLHDNEDGPEISVIPLVEI